MATIHFKEKNAPSIKKGQPPSRKWKKLFYISLGINVILVLTTIYTLCG